MMVDFRYHLVSLVAVFLALACGIVLGAGPLRTAIGDTVSGRNAALTAQNAQLTTERDAAVADEKAVFATVESISVVPARGRIGGIVVQLNVREGDSVTSGQAIAAIGDEKLANPFLRADRADVAANVGMAGKPAVDVFAEVRARKNKF